MRSFIIKLDNFFKLDNNRPIDSNFDSSKRELLIPLYQREYKWTQDKVQGLIKDINQRDKFLGIIILDEKQNCYEIVDGQQRITTCFLILLALYNYYKGSKLEQQTILSYIKPYDKLILKNDSVGEYVSEEGDELKVQITRTKDVYFQKEVFESSFQLIYNFINELSAENVREFKRQLLDCEFLVMINDVHGATRPVEQIFLDINEKAQLLEVEDIFKGHCFENFDASNHMQLKEKWARLKHCGMYFKKQFWFKDLSQYLYLYLLECVNKDMPENLSPNDKHFLEGKNMDETLRCLNEMISFGESIIDFRNNICRSNYDFTDLCKESYKYKGTDDYKYLKVMSLFILDCKMAQYQKLPFMQFISFLSLSDMKDDFTYLNFRKSIMNLYVYANLFVYIGGRKSKKDVDHNVYEALKLKNIDLVLKAIKELRIEKVQAFELSAKTKGEMLRFVYSVMDYYVSNDSWLRQIYVDNDNFNIEHFIIPDNKPKRIIWKNKWGDKQMYFNNYGDAKKKAINYLIIDKTLNESLHEYDIVCKIELIKKWYADRSLSVPNHINVIVETIEKMEQYNELKKLKDNPEADETEIIEKYNRFLDAYFNPDAEAELLKKLSDKFKEAFQN